jgi:glutathionylspermidine synthase
MQRVTVAERPEWRAQAEKLGFQFHTMNGAPYWDESAYYRFSLRAIEQDLERPTEELHELCMDLVERAVRDEAYLRNLAIPERFWDFLRRSYLSGDPHIYGRMDLAYDGRGPAKLYELNYDTPTSIYEAGVFQWVWMEQSIERGVIPLGSDQFNRLHEDLLRAFRHVRLGLDAPLHFASVRDSVEDRGTVDYLRDAAHQAGIETRFVTIEEIGRTADGRFTDLDDRLVRAIFKLYPWEFMFADEFGALLADAPTVWFEPPWKSILSNKGALALLWELHPNHPNLLPAYIDPEPHQPLAPGWVRKPFFSREGANVEMVTPQGERVAIDGPYTDAPFVRQAFHALPRFGDQYPLIGSWLIGDRASGIGIREDASLITQDTSRFLPHIIVD